jgi:hypothetical protein
MSGRIRKLVVPVSVASLLLLARWPLAARPAKDVIHFKNKDTWTCEIKKLDQGYRDVGLDYVDGTVQVNWPQIESIESPQFFVVKDTRGQMISGVLSASATAEGTTVTVGTGESAVKVLKSQVVAIQQTEPRFWHNFHGAANMGFNFSKSSHQTQYNLSGNLSHIERYWEVNTQTPIVVHRLASNAERPAQHLSIYGLRMPGSRNYFLASVADFLRSDEQQLQLRMTFGGGKILLSTERSRILVMAGAVWTREQYTTADTPELNSAEGMVGTALEYYRFKTTNCSLTFLLIRA